LVCATLNGASFACLITGPRLIATPAGSRIAHTVKANQESSIQELVWQECLYGACATFSVRLPQRKGKLEPQAVRCIWLWRC
jgi:hypothetical protein